VLDIGVGALGVAGGWMVVKYMKNWTVIFHENGIWHRDLMGKIYSFTDAEVKAILEEAKTAMGENGRIVTRPSGTEPLIRVMTEGDDSELAKRIAEETAERIKVQLDTYN